MSEDRGQMSEDRGQMSEDRGQMSEDRGQKAEDRGQKAEGFEFGLRPLRAVGNKLYELEAIGAGAYAPVGRRKTQGDVR